MRIAALNLTQKEEDDEEEVVEQKGRRAVETRKKIYRAVSSDEYSEYRERCGQAVELVQNQILQVGWDCNMKLN